jgi:hypothetical protein
MLGPGFEPCYEISAKLGHSMLVKTMTFPNVQIRR